MDSLSNTASPRPRPHAIAIPYPAQGHINPMMQLCKKLATRGFKVTFVNIDFFHERLLEIQTQSGTETSIEDDGLDIKFASLRAAGIDLKENPKVSIEDLSQATLTLVAPLEDLIEQLSRENSKVTCIVSDALMSSWTQEIADKYNVPKIAFFTSALTVNLFFFLLDILISKGLYLYKDGKICSQVANASISDAADLITDVPGLPPLRPVDFPTFAHNGDSTDFMTTFAYCQFQHVRKSDRVLANTFYELEPAAIDTMSKLFPVYPIGPLLTTNFSGGNDKRVCTSLWPEQDACLLWLDEQPPSSVLYISFGSITVFSRVQFEEIMMGLEGSEQRFLVVVRPDMIDGGSEDASQEFSSGRKGKMSYFVSWAPQFRVLSHASVGGFLTHCGWNSILEAVYNGVPMAAWPYFADQMIDCRLIVNEWKVGLNFKAGDDGVVRREEVERVVKDLMQGGARAEIKKEAAKLRDAARASIREGGASRRNLEDFIQHMYSHPMR